DGNTLRHLTCWDPSISTSVPPGAKIPIVPAHISGRAVLERRTVQYRRGDAESAAEFPAPHALDSRGLAQVLLSVPWLSQGEAIGIITAVRVSPLPFSANEIAQLETFADQAVIAIENARLFQALQDRNRELSEALAQQTATAEVLQVIAESPTDVGTVFQLIV